MDRSTWKGRARNARDYLASAKNELELAEEGANGNPIMSLIVLSAIAFADALTIKYGGIQNTRDHAVIVKTMKRALGNQVDQEQLKRLGHIVTKKPAAQYDFRISTIEEARSLFAQLIRFSRWAETELSRP